MDLKTHAHFAGVIDLLLDAICVVDSEGRFVFVSAAFERIFGYTPDEIIGTSMIELVAPEDRERTLRAANEIMSGQPKFNFENRYVRKDGQIVHIMWSARWSEADRLRIAVARDITARKQSESMQAALYAISEAAHMTEDLLALFKQIHAIIGDLLPTPDFSVALYDADEDSLSFPYHAGPAGGRSRADKPAAGTLCGEVIRNGQALLLTQEELAALPSDLRADIDPGLLCWLGVPLKSQRGVVGALVLKSFAGGAGYTGKDRDLLQFVSTQIGTAIERMRLHARLRYLAQYDGLTGLPNRSLLYDRIESALARARREQGQISVLYVDLDRFKQVNDALGHAAGDQLLREVAHRLKHCVRDTDTVARVGGDEFIVVLEHLRKPEDASIVAGKIRVELARPVEIDGHSLCVVPSVGIALFPDHGDGISQLLKHADDAMYDMKNSGRRAASAHAASSASGT